MDIHGDYFNQSEDEEDEEFDDESENSVESDNEQDDFDGGNFTYFEDLDKRFLIRNNYVFKWYRKNAGGSEYWLCKRCLQHSVTVDNNLIANENAHSIEDDVEDVCVHTYDEILCLKTVVKIRKRGYKEITYF